jgi:putative mRNA 3-end processing factor
VNTERGLFCEPGNFYLDPKKSVETAVVSHAHKDHYNNDCAKFFCTPLTSTLIQARENLNPNLFNSFEFSEQFEINGVELKFIPAGHILGSAQVWMKYEDITYLYTGDIKTQADSSCEPFEFGKCDVLICETTFANPTTKHPNASEEILKLKELENHNVAIGTYALGKTQRVLSLINEFLPDREVFIHRNSVKFNKIYERAGFVLGNYEPYNRKSFKRSQNGIYLLPPGYLIGFGGRGDCYKVLATGWKAKHKHNSLSLVISDHSDWDEIVNVIDKSNCSEIWTVHGDGCFVKEHYGTQKKVKFLA